LFSRPLPSRCRVCTSSRCLDASCRDPSMHNVSCSGNCTLYADHIIDVGTRLLYTIGVVLCFSSENYSAVYSTILKSCGVLLMETLPKDNQCTFSNFRNCINASFRDYVSHEIVKSILNAQSPCPPVRRSMNVPPYHPSKPQAEVPSSRWPLIQKQLSSIKTLFVRNLPPLHCISR